MIETTGEGKSAVATPDGKSRKKKKKKIIDCRGWVRNHFPLNRLVWRFSLFVFIYTTFPSAIPYPVLVTHHGTLSIEMSPNYLLEEGYIAMSVFIADKSMTWSYTLWKTL